MTSLDWYGWPVLAIAHGFRRGSISVYADSGQDARGEGQEHVMLLETDGTGQGGSTHDNFDRGRAAEAIDFITKIGRPPGLNRKAQARHERRQMVRECGHPRSTRQRAPAQSSRSMPGRRRARFPVLERPGATELFRAGITEVRRLSII